MNSQGCYGARFLGASGPNDIFDGRLIIGHVNRDPENISSAVSNHRMGLTLSSEVFGNGSSLINSHERVVVLLGRVFCFVLAAGGPAPLFPFFLVRPSP